MVRQLPITITAMILYYSIIQYITLLLNILLYYSIYYSITQYITLLLNQYITLLLNILLSILLYYSIYYSSVDSVPCS